MTYARSSGMRGPGLSSEFEEFDTKSHTPCPFRGGGFKRYAHSAGPMPNAIGT